MTKSQSTILALYHYDSCPFCAKTRRSIDELNVDVELRNIELNHQHRIDLQQGCHKTTVPCLRVDNSNGETILSREKAIKQSDDIIHYFAKQQNELFRITRMA